MIGKGAFQLLAADEEAEALTVSSLGVILLESKYYKESENATPQEVNEKEVVCLFYKYRWNDPTVGYNQRPAFHNK